MAVDQFGQTDRETLTQELRAAEKSYDDFLAKVRKQDKEQVSLMMMEEFYSNLRTMNKSSALRQAQLKTMQEIQDGQCRDPQEKKGTLL